MLPLSRPLSQSTFPKIKGFKNYSMVMQCDSEFPCFLIPTPGNKPKNPRRTKPTLIGKGNNTYWQANGKSVVRGWKRKETEKVAPHRSNNKSLHGKGKFTVANEVRRVERVLGQQYRR